MDPQLNDLLYVCIETETSYYGLINDSFNMVRFEDRGYT